MGAKMWFRALIATLGVVVVASSALPVRAAEPSAADRDTSRSLYAQGMEALDKRDFAAAERACGGAYALVKVPTAGTCWARALVGLGKLIEARDVFVEATHIPAKPDEAAVLTRARETAGTEADALEKRIPTVTLAVSGPPEGAPLQVVVDGASVRAETARLPRKMNAGHHTLSVSAEGFGPTVVDVTIAEGEERRIPVALSPMAPGEARKKPEQPAAPLGTPAPTQAPSGGVPTLALLSGGVGVAGLVVGAVTALAATSKHTTLEGECTGSICPASAQSDLSSFHAMRTVSAIGYTLGALGIVGGGVLWFVTPSRPSDASAGVWLGPASAGVVGAF